MKKGIFIFSLYLFYILLFYFLIPFVIFYFQNFNFGGWHFFIIIFLIAPLLSFYIPNLILKKFSLNKTTLYVIHTITIILIPIIYFYTIIVSSFSHIQIG